MQAIRASHKNRFSANRILQITLFFFQLSMSTDRLSVLTTAKAKSFFLKEAKTAESKLLNLAVKEFGEDAKYVLAQMHLQQKAELKVPGWLLCLGCLRPKASSNVQQSR